MFSSEYEAFHSEILYHNEEDILYSMNVDVDVTWAWRGEKIDKKTPKASSVCSQKIHLLSCQVHGTLTLLVL